MSRAYGVKFCVVYYIYWKVMVGHQIHIVKNRFRNCFKIIFMRCLNYPKKALFQTPLETYSLSAIVGSIRQPVLLLTFH